jgi:hypothetical protein
MAEMASDEIVLKFLGTLNEAQGRWYVASEAITRGRGGIKAMEQLTGMARNTILKGIRELRGSDPLPEFPRARRPGGGRKRLEHEDPGLTEAIEAIMRENTAGDPMSHLRWTNKSIRAIAEELTRQGHAASSTTVRRRLQDLDYSLQANRKNKEGLSPPERDEQFRNINRQVKRFICRGEPVISVDTKKKEKVGNFKNPGRKWRKKRNPRDVLSKDFPNLAEGKAIPYGAFDMQRNEGFVNVGVSHDTAEFAVESLRRWWKSLGRRQYPEAKAVLVCADCGGSNGNRTRAWKYHLQKFAEESGLQVTVCHYPPGTSKWNKIEHQMFSFISMNWRGEPLVDYKTIVNLIGSTKTKTGLRIKAKMDRRKYKTGIRITDEQMESINIKKHKKLPAWNYTIFPKPPKETI